MPWKNDTAFLTILMTMLGSIASYSNRILQGNPFSLITLILQVVIAAFAGAMTYLIALINGWDPEYTGAVAGLAGWAGVEAIKLIERIFTKKLKRILSDDH